MSILTVQKTFITLGAIKVDAYTADERRSDGSYVNYLSGAGLASSIGLAASTALHNRMSQELKSKLGSGFTVLQGQYKMVSGGSTKLSLWSTLDAPKYWMYHYKSGNERAGEILESLVSTTLDIIVNDQFQREYKAFQAQQWTEGRILTKETFWFMGASIEAYYDRHPRVEKFKGQNYSDAFDALNLGLFGLKAKEIRNILGIGKNKLNRDHFGRQSLKRIEMIQRIAEAQVTHCDMSPPDAVNWAIAKMHYDQIDFSE